MCVNLKGGWREGEERVSEEEKTTLRNNLFKKSILVAENYDGFYTKPRNLLSYKFRPWKCGEAACLEACMWRHAAATTGFKKA
jgi:hypothetical protein